MGGAELCLKGRIFTAQNTHFWNGFHRWMTTNSTFSAWMMQDIVLSAPKACGTAGYGRKFRAGNGAHVWFFFAEPVSAADARKLGSGLLTRTMTCRHELSFASYDRLFPSQNFIPKGGLEI